MSNLIEKLNIDQKTCYICKKDVNLFVGAFDDTEFDISASIGLLVHKKCVPFSYFNQLNQLKTTILLKTLEQAHKERQEHPEHFLHVDEDFFVNNFKNLKKNTTQ